MTFTRRSTDGSLFKTLRDIWPLLAVIGTLAISYGALRQDLQTIHRDVDNISSNSKELNARVTHLEMDQNRTSYILDEIRGNTRQIKRATVP